MKNCTKQFNEKWASLYAIVILGVLLNGCNQLPNTCQISGTVIPAELRLSYNSQTTRLDNGKCKTVFHEKWINYMDGYYQWKEIKPDFVKTTRGFEMTQAPFEVLAPFYADGEAVFNNNNRYDVFTQKIIYDKPLEQTIQALGTVHVAGKIETGNLGWGNTQYVVYPNAYPQYHADLIYWVHQGTAPRLRKFIRFNEQLSENTDFQFRVIYSDEVETVNNGKNVSVKLKGAESKRGSGWADFYIWDSKGGWDKRQPIRFDFEKPQIASNTNMTTDANEYILTKHIDASYFKNATLPVFTDATSTFYPDPDPETTTVDGDLFAYHAGGGISSSSVRNAADCDAGYADYTSTQALARSDWFSNNGFVFDRFVTLFNTSSLTSNATISSATESVYVISTTDGDNDGTDFISVTTASPASNTSLVSADFSQTGGTSPIEQIDNVNRQDITSIATNAYLPFTFNSTGIGNINKTGISKFCLREGHDMLNTPIAQSNGQGDYIYAYTADQPGTTQDPMLVIIYDTAAPTPATVDWDNSNVQEITLSENRSFTFANGNNGGLYTLLVKQDGTGGWNINWPANVKWASGTPSTLSSSANAVDVIKFVYDGTNYLVTGTTLDIR